MTTYKKYKNIAVLMGGWSNEREVSLATGKAVCDELGHLGYNVCPVDLTPDIPALCHLLAQQKVDVVFNALHGAIGEDGRIQSLLDILKIPYTHSGLLASSLALNKVMAKRIFQQSNIPTPDYAVVPWRKVHSQALFEYPYVVKPINSGSSVGVYIIHSKVDIEMMKETWHDDYELLIEPYIAGLEVQAAVMGDQALGAIEIRPKKKFYDYVAKYTDGFAEHIMPASIPEEDYQKVLDYALRAHKAIGCRGVSRSDFRYQPPSQGQKGKIYILEINTQPGLTSLSLVPEIAAYAGIPFRQLVNWMVEEATWDE